MEIKIGTGGWQYLGVNGDRLKAYSESFNFVEVNSTFYSNPSFRVVESWRSRVHEDFEFAVKCNRVVTHENSLRPTPESMAEVNYLVKVCGILKAGCVVFQTPPSLNVDHHLLTEAKGIFETFKREGITVVLEARNLLDDDTLSLMQNYDLVHSVDLTRGLPGYTKKVLYTRLFGMNRYSRAGFGTAEYEAIEKGLKKESPKKAYLAFHGIQMYRDAAVFTQRLANIH